jgi:hypothetical protein
VLLAARKSVIAECDIGSDEHIIPHAQSVPKLYAILDRHAIANDNIVLNETMRADVAFGTDPRAWEYHDKLPQSATVTNLDGLHIRQRVDVRLVGCIHTTAL